MQLVDVSGGKRFAGVIGRSGRLQAAGAAIIALCLMGATNAHAGASGMSISGFICERVEADMFVVDGRIDDWRGMRGKTIKSGRDAGVEFRCAYDDKNLHIAVNVADERVVRTRQAVAKAEDRLTVDLSVGAGKRLSFAFLPGSPTAKPKRIGVPRYVQIQDSLQDQGWSVELTIPMNRIESWYRSVAFLSAKILVHDVDVATAGGPEDVVGLSGRLCFSEAEATMRAFMKSARLRWKDIRLDTLADVDPGSGPERIVHGGRIIGVLSDAFVFMQLPVASGSDVVGVKTVDLDGEGRAAIIVEFRQRGDNGSRNLVGVWFVDGQGQFHQALTIEVARELSDGRRLKNRWSLVPRGSRRAGPGKRKKPRVTRGFDILVEAESASGWTASNYREPEEPMVRSILKPWDEQPAQVYFFEGTAAYNEAPVDEEPAGKKRRRR